VPNNSKSPWARRPGEPVRAYEYAWAYFVMGGQRSIDKVAEALDGDGGQKGGKRGARSKQLQKLSRKWQWVKRALAYDGWIQEKNLEAAELFAEQEAAKWQDRERNRRERVFTHSEIMLDRSKAMLDYPLAVITKETVVDGAGRATEITKVMPARWNMTSAARLAVSGAALGDAAIRNIGGTPPIKIIDVYEDLVAYKGKAK